MNIIVETWVLFTLSFYQVFIKLFLNNDFLTLPCIKICYFIMRLNRMRYSQMILLIFNSLKLIGP